jgi:hypothetical protein
MSKKVLTYLPLELSLGLNLLLLRSRVLQRSRSRTVPTRFYFLVKSNRKVLFDEFSRKRSKSGFVLDSGLVIVDGVRPYLRVTHQQHTASISYHQLIQYVYSSLLSLTLPHHFAFLKSLIVITTI